MLISNIEIFAQLSDEESADVTGGLDAVDDYEGGPVGRRRFDSGPLDPNTTNKTNEFLSNAGIGLWEIGCSVLLGEWLNPIGDLGACGYVADESRKSSGG